MNVFEVRMIDSCRIVFQPFKIDSSEESMSTTTPLSEFTTCTIVLVMPPLLESANTIPVLRVQKFANNEISIIINLI